MGWCVPLPHICRGIFLTAPPICLHSWCGASDAHSIWAHDRCVLCAVFVSGAHAIFCSRPMAKEWWFIEKCSICLTWNAFDTKRAFSFVRVWKCGIIYGACCYTWCVWCCGDTKKKVRQHNKVQSFVVHLTDWHLSNHYRHYGSAHARHIPFACFMFKFHHLACCQMMMDICYLLQNLIWLSCVIAASDAKC